MFYNIYADFALNKQLGFQDPATPIMEGIIDLHNYIVFFLCVICIFVIWMMLCILYRFWFISFKYLRPNLKSNKPKISLKLYFWSFFESNLNPFDKIKAVSIFFRNLANFKFFFRQKFLNKLDNYYYRQNLKKYYQYLLYLRILNRRRFLDIINETKGIHHGVFLEIVWTVLPSFILIFIAVPSFILLYSIDEIIITPNSIVLKVIGNQWFWSYELSFPQEYFNINLSNMENCTITYDSYMLTTDDLNIGQLRLLAVDKELFMPVHTHVKVLVTSRDVLHSWAIPSLGIKVDAVPGRLNACSAYIKRDGIFYGQCSEICGVNHAFMPIVIKTIPEFTMRILNHKTIS